tara:strand:+ start:1035 stop:1484 length:450 start_codon:yes stop_codon:yes gene_type:complete
VRSCIVIVTVFGPRRRLSAGAVLSLGLRARRDCGAAPVEESRSDASRCSREVDLSFGATDPAANSLAKMTVPLLLAALLPNPVVDSAPFSSNVKLNGDALLLWGEFASLLVALHGRGALPGRLPRECEMRLAGDESTPSCSSFCREACC